MCTAKEVAYLFTWRLFNIDVLHLTWLDETMLSCVKCIINFSGMLCIAVWYYACRWYDWTRFNSAKLLSSTANINVAIGPITPEIDAQNFLRCYVYWCECGWVLLVKVQQYWAIHRSYSHCSLWWNLASGIEETDNNIWFCNGWQDFTEYHSICYGYFLVFRYEGNSSFHIVIFDKTAIEIQYPCRKNCKLEDHQVKISKT